MKAISLFFLLLVIFYGCKSESTTEIIDDNNSSKNSIYIGGKFTIEGKDSTNNIAFWDGKTWNSLGTGLTGNVDVECMAYYKGELFVGGFIDSAGGIPAQNIARWDGNKWASVGSGINGRVTSLIAYDGLLYAGGWFSIAGGSQADNIAKWDGANWSAVGEGLSDEVYTLEVFNNELYVGGWFTKNPLGNFGANKIAKWDGTKWDTVGSGMSTGIPGAGWVHNLTIFNNELYASGNFSKCDTLSVVNIAKWNNNVWQSIDGANLSNRIYSSIKFNNEIHFAGESDTNLQNTLPYYAVWNDASWNFNLFSFDGTPYCLCSSDDYLYVGGIFKTVNGKIVNGIFKWDGSKIQNLASGVNGFVSSILLK
jgi:trimeric autotransporter adhesin